MVASCISVAVTGSGASIEHVKSVPAASPPTASSNDPESSYARSLTGNTRAASSSSSSRWSSAISSARFFALAASSFESVTTSSSPPPSSSRASKISSADARGRLNRYALTRSGAYSYVRLASTDPGAGGAISTISPVSHPTRTFSPVSFQAITDTGPGADANPTGSSPVPGNAPPAEKKKTFPSADPVCGARRPWGCIRARSPFGCAA
jgi:hypothetical protein